MSLVVVTAFAVVVTAALRRRRLGVAYRFGEGGRLLLGRGGELSFTPPPVAAPGRARRPPSPRSGGPRRAASRARRLGCLLRRAGAFVRLWALELCLSLPGADAAALGVAYGVVAAVLGALLREAAGGVGLRLSGGRRFALALEAEVEVGALPFGRPQGGLRGTRFSPSSGEAAPRPSVGRPPPGAAGRSPGSRG